VTEHCLLEFTAGFRDLAVNRVQPTQAVVKCWIVSSTRSKSRLKRVHSSGPIITLETNYTDGCVGAGSELCHCRCPMFGRNSQWSLRPVQQSERMLGRIACAI
jgi:hypothetical protein